MPRKRAKRRARGTSPHPGVVLRKRKWPGGGYTWFARWEDPFTGKTTDTNLNKIEITSDTTRRNWAIKKAELIAADLQAVAAGRVARDAPQEVGAAVKDYVDSAKGRLREKTLSSYLESLNLFKVWAAEVGVHEVRALTPPLLHRLRGWLAGRPRLRAKAGGERGEWEEATGPRSAAAINRDLRQIKAFLNDARRRGIAPRIEGEHVREQLGALRVDIDRPAFFRPVELEKLLKAAQRHDAARFKLTRDEKAAGKAAGTPRHEPIAPLVLATLMTGARIGELLSLPWSAVNLESRGEIIVEATAAKTHRARAVDLGVSPSVARLLARMRLASGGAAFVFGGEAPLRRALAEAARRRLVKRYGAPAFSWHELRSTCATYSTNAAGLFGAASAYQSAKRLGHSVVVAERHYAGVVSDLPVTAKTLEAVMGVVELADQIADEGRLPQPQREAG